MNIKAINEKFITFINKNKFFENNDKVLVALSGGSDSMFLLSILSEFRTRWNLNIVAAHINHSLRNTAERDENFCKEVCVRMSIPLISEIVDVVSFKNENKLSLEEAARILRYNKLESIKSKHNCTKIATAHNLNDNTETVLLNLLKGTGIEGISGIPLKRNDIIRPILCFSKKEIMFYLDSLKIDYVTDETNFDDSYDRNFLRNVILPKLRTSINPMLDSNIFKFSQTIREFSDSFNNLTEDRHSNVSFFNNVLYINCSVLNLTDFEVKNIIIKSLQSYLNLQLSYKNIENLVLLFSKKTGSKICLSDNFIATKDRDNIVISKVSYDESTEFMFSILPLSETIKYTIRCDVFDNNNEILNSNKFCEFFDYDKFLKQEIFVRNWKFGDKFKPLGLQNFKNVSDFLQERKISTINKKNTLVLCNDETIFWVLGHRIDDRFKITNNTKRILKICFEQKKDKQFK